MWKFIILIKRIVSGSFKRFFNNLEIVHKESSKNRLVLFVDMLFSIFIYGVGYLDYLTFGYAYIGHKKRKTFINMNDNVKMCKKLNDPLYINIFQDKRRFYKTFREYLKREYVELEDGYDAFEKFCQGKKCFFAKGPESFGGLEVEKINIDDKTNLVSLYDWLFNKGLLIVEEAIIQHEKMSWLCEKSVNTLRIVTVIGAKGTPKCIYVLIRVGSGSKDVDNITSGGMYTLVNSEGVIKYPMFCDKTVEYYDRHPANGHVFLGMQIPYFKEAVDLCLDAALVVPGMRYVGWDVAITPTGPVIVEGNDLPGYDMCQNHRFHEDGCGLKREFELALGEKL